MYQLSTFSNVSTVMPEVVELFVSLMLSCLIPDGLCLFYIYWTADSVEHLLVAFSLYYCRVFAEEIELVMLFHKLIPLFSGDSEDGWCWWGVLGGNYILLFEILAPDLYEVPYHVEVRAQ